MSDLNTISDAIRAALTAKTAARDLALGRSRELIRHCSECIRAIHRREWETADHKLEIIRAAAHEMTAPLADYPDLYYSGYAQDALKELVEAFLTYAIIRDQPLPTPEALNVSAATYLNGMAEAATELRRFILDIMRLNPETDAGASNSAEAERLLDWMDRIYDQLVTFDFPDAITNNLRRQTDIVRGVLERTRGDLTTSFRQQELQAALQRLEARILKAD